MSEFIDPFGRTIFEHTRPDGSVELQFAPGQLVCDFCLHPDPAWEYPCGPVVIVGSPNIEASDDEWAACDECRRLIEGEGNVEQIARDMVGRQPPPTDPHFGERPFEEAVAILAVNLAGFLAARRGPARPIR
jgi:hypothetical protein